MSAPTVEQLARSWLSRLLDFFTFLVEKRVFPIPQWDLIEPEVRATYIDGEWPLAITDINNALELIEDSSFSGDPEQMGFISRVMNYLPENAGYPWYRDERYKLTQEFDSKEMLYFMECILSHPTLAGYKAQFMGLTSADIEIRKAALANLTKDLPVDQRDQLIREAHALDWGFSVSGPKPEDIAILNEAISLLCRIYKLNTLVSGISNTEPTTNCKPPLNPPNGPKEESCR